MARTENGFKDEFKFLSNMEFCTVFCFNTIYHSVENAYQASKCANKEDRKKFQHHDPYKAKKDGKTVQMRPDFNDKRLEFMETLLRRKFSDKNFHLKQKLIETGDLELVEVNNWGDTFYGECNGVGENHLGKLLMKVRKDLIEWGSNLEAMFPAGEVSATKVEEYNNLNRNHDYTYMFSDCGNTWRHGEKVKRELELRYSSLTETEKDLVGLYHNHILKRCNRGTDYAQFCKQVKNLPDTLEEACKYYQEINPRDIK